MGKFVEPLIVREINRDVAPGALDYSGRRVLNPVRDVLNARYLTSDGGQSGKVEHIKGTTAIPTELLPDGINECIGTYENIEKNALFFWIWNSNGVHGVYWLDGATDQVTLVIADDPDSPVLKFDRYHLITGIGMIGDILTWTDDVNPQRYININRSYPILNDQVISLAKIGPKRPPTFSARTNDTSVAFNRLSSDSFQFAFQYVYKDNEVSVLSPYSRLSTGDVWPQVSSTSRAKVLVTHLIDSEVEYLLKEVRLLYRKNNEPNWYVWKQVSNFTGSISAFFFNNENGTLLPESQTTKLFDQIPNKSRALTIFRGRIFLNISEEGFDFVPPNISASVGSQVNLDSTDITNENIQNRGGFIKKKGNYLVGIFFRGHLGRLSGITSKATVTSIEPGVTVSYDINSNPHTLDIFNKLVRKINVTLSGVGPPNSEYFIAITNERNYASYMQVPGHILFYLGSHSGGDNINPYVGVTVKISGTDRIYRVGRSSNSAGKYLHILLPRGLPWIPDKDCFVRYMHQNVTRVERVLDFLDGHILVTGSFGIENWKAQAVGIGGMPFFEIFKPNETIAPFFYSVAGPFKTDSAGELQTKTITGIDGDTFMLHLREFSYLDYNLQAFERINSVLLRSFVTPYLFVESKSPITKSTATITNELAPPTNTFISQDVHPENGITPDLTRIAWSQGWPIVESRPLLQQRESTISYSDPYIEGTQINGLNSFPVDNVYDKIGQERSPITKLIPVGNILVAVHERHVTSIYVGEGIVRSGETGFITKVESVIGDDRKLNGEWGSYHPESVQEIEGQLFGYDIFSGCVWRYTVEGLIAISDFGLMDHFKTRSEQYFPHKDSLRFVSSIDRYHKEYLLTLPPLYLTKETVSQQSITSGRTYDFILDPEQYEEGQTYRLKLVLFNQSQADAHRITVDAYFDDDTDQDIVSNVSHKVQTNVQADAEAIYIEFLYEGQSYVTIEFSDVTNDVYAAISSEYQELAGETWAYNYRAKQWAQRYSFIPEYMGKLGTSVILFDKGLPYRHSSSSTYNNFFGRQYQSRIEIEANPQPEKDKTWSAIQIDREIAADPAGAIKVIEVSNDKGQASYTRAKEFEQNNGVYFGPILKDVNTNPSLLPEGSIALRDGKDMRSKTLNIVINNDSAGPARLQKLNILGEFSESSM